MNIEKIKEIYEKAEDRMKNINIGCFKGMDKPLFKISDCYPGIWLEHLYDSVMYARLYRGENEYLKNAIELFIDNQTEEGQLPCFILDKANFEDGTELVGYYQIQECLSLGRVSLEAYYLTADIKLLEKCYNATKKWVSWLKKYRMTQNKGLVEMFCGYDTGHDNSSRLIGFSCKGNYCKEGVYQNAKVLPPQDDVAPAIAVDMNCNFYGNLINLSKMAKILNREDESEMWAEEAKKVKRLLFDICFDKDDAFFYDVDKNGNKRKIRSSAIFHLFLEGVLDNLEDEALIEEIYTRHLKNPEEFWTPVPFPSMAYNDPSAIVHEEKNSWGYFCQMLIYLRCTLWMDKYGFTAELDRICVKALECLSDNFEILKLGQELDPITGIPSQSSEWYSTAMLFFVYAARRLGIVDVFDI